MRPPGRVDKKIRRRSPKVSTFSPLLFSLPQSGVSNRTVSVDQSYGAGADTASLEEEGEGGFGERDPGNHGEEVAAPAAPPEKAEAGVGGVSTAAAEMEAAAVPPSVFRQVWDDNNK